MLKINKQTRSANFIRVDDTEDGKIYMDTDGDIFIANRSDGVVLFSVCGRYAYRVGDGDVLVQEVEAELTIKN